MDANMEKQAGKRAASDQSKAPKAKIARYDSVDPDHSHRDTGTPYKKASTIKIRPAAEVRADERKHKKPSKLSMPGEIKPVQGPKIKKTNPYPNVRQIKQDRFWHDMIERDKLDDKLAAGQLSRPEYNHYVAMLEIKEEAYYDKQAAAHRANKRDVEYKRIYRMRKHNVEL